jgi:hypothetical protein
VEELKDGRAHDIAAGQGVLVDEAEFAQHAREIVGGGFR